MQDGRPARNAPVCRGTYCWVVEGRLGGTDHQRSTTFTDRITGDFDRRSSVQPDEESSAQRRSLIIAAVMRTLLGRGGVHQVHCSRSTPRLPQRERQQRRMQKTAPRRNTNELPRPELAGSGCPDFSRNSNGRKKQEDVAQFRVSRQVDRVEL